MRGYRYCTAEKCGKPEVFSRVSFDEVSPDIEPNSHAQSLQSFAIANNCRTRRSTSIQECQGSLQPDPILPSLPPRRHQNCRNNPRSVVGGIRAIAGLGRQTRKATSSNFPDSS